LGSALAGKLYRFRELKSFVDFVGSVANRVLQIAQAPSHIVAIYMDNGDHAPFVVLTRVGFGSFKREQAVRVGLLVIFRKMRRPNANAIGWLEPPRQAIRTGAIRTHKPALAIRRAIDVLLALASRIVGFDRGRSGPLAAPDEWPGNRQKRGRTATAHRSLPLVIVRRV
jgi:hypothetical protein